MEVLLLEGEITLTLFKVVDLANTTNFKVKANGEVYARYIKVTLQSFPDFVFDKEYNLDPIPEMEAYYKINKHLKGIPSESEVLKNDLDLGQIAFCTIKVVEEHAIYIAQLYNQHLKDIEEIKKTADELKEIKKELYDIKKQLSKK